jgi:predicted alpha/beta hydrolase family esterase
MSAADGYRPRRPPLSRTLAEAAAMPGRARVDPGVAELRSRVPRGDGHAVLVMPTSLHGDPQTEDVRSFLRDIGYVPFGWDFGVNLGPTARVVAGLPDRLAALAARHGPVSVVGFSMGGLFARWLAVRAPAQVRSVVTVCSPFRAPMDSVFLPLEPLAEAWWGREFRALAEEMARPLDCPATFVFSRDDGIVAWESCRDATRPDDNFETHGPHVSIAQNLDVFRIVAERLARN